MKNSDVIDRILQYHPPLPEGFKGCDGYKFGNPQDECHGVATAIVATVDVIKKAAELGCNLLVVHEPTFYSTPDYSGWEAGFSNDVYEEKCDLLKKHGITIWRDHDHMHVNEPDSIFTGVLKHLGWEEYQKETPGNAPFTFYMEIPEMTVKDMALYLKEKLLLNGIRYIGKENDIISKVAIVGHLNVNAFGSDYEDENGYYHEYATDLIQMMEAGVDAIIPGEVIDWTVMSYIRDAVMQGKKKAAFNCGHFNWEQPGMQYAEEWIREITEGKLPVHFIETGDIYQFL